MEWEQLNGDDGILKFCPVHQYLVNLAYEAALISAKVEIWFFCKIIESM